MNNAPVPSGQQTLQQRRAASAWNAVKKIPVSDQKKYGSLVRGFPAMIQTDGIGPALAFLKAKGNAEHLSLNQHVSAWVLREMKAPETESDLLLWLTEQSSARYRQATVEALAYLMWLKRFAEAEGWTEGNGQ